MYRDADRNSVEAQNLYLRLTMARLVCLVIASIVGLVTFRRAGADWAGVALVLLFALPLLIEALLLTRKPEKAWYDGRATAESAKTLAWRYMVGGNPFGMDSPDADSHFLRRLDAVAAQFPGIHLKASAQEQEQITATMRSFRGATLDERKSLYRTARILAQQSWYSAKAGWNDGRALKWALGLLLLEFSGVVGGVLKAAGLIEVDALGVAGGICAGAVAWVTVKQHTVLATSYAIASQELVTIASRIAAIADEAEWAEFVAQAEEAVSREHTTWRASHS